MLAHGIRATHTTVYELVQWKFITPTRSVSRLQCWQLKCTILPFTMPKRHKCQHLLPYFSRVSGIPRSPRVELGAHKLAERRHGPTSSYRWVPPTSHRRASSSGSSLAMVSFIHASCAVVCSNLEWCLGMDVVWWASHTFSACSGEQLRPMNPAMSIR